MTTESFGSLDDLPESSDVASRTPRIVLTVVALLVAVVIAVVVVVFALATVSHVIEVGSEVTVADLETVEQRTNIALPAGTEVVASTQTADVFTATLLLPPGASPDFPLAGYRSVATPSADLAPSLVGEAVLAYLAAESSELEASAALVDRAGETVLFVDVRAVR